MQGISLQCEYSIDIRLQVTYLPSAGQKTKLISEFESSNIKTMAENGTEEEKQPAMNGEEDVEMKEREPSVTLDLEQ